MAKAAEPAPLRLLKGTGPGRDSGGRKVADPPAFVRVPPEAPDWLTDYAREEWDRVVPGLARVNVLKPEDQANLAAYCEQVATFRVAQEILEREGYTIEAKQGTLRHPAVGIRNDAHAKMLAAAAHFGLTPSSEQTLGKSGDGRGDDDNPFD